MQKGLHRRHRYPTLIYSQIVVRVCGVPTQVPTYSSNLSQLNRLSVLWKRIRKLRRIEFFNQEYWTHFFSSHFQNNNLKELFILFNITFHYQSYLKIFFSIITRAVTCFKHIWICSKSLSLKNILFMILNTYSIFFFLKNMLFLKRTCLFLKII